MKRPDVPWFRGQGAHNFRRNFTWGEGVGIVPGYRFFNVGVGFRSENQFRLVTSATTGLVRLLEPTLARIAGAQEWA